MLVPPFNVSHNGTNWKDRQTDTQIAFYILMTQLQIDLTAFQILTEVLSDLSLFKIYIFGLVQLINNFKSLTSIVYDQMCPGLHHGYQDYQYYSKI